MEVSLSCLDSVYFISLLCLTFFSNTLFFRKASDKKETQNVTSAGEREVTAVEGHSSNLRVAVNKEDSLDFVGFI